MRHGLQNAVPIVTQSLQSHNKDKRRCGQPIRCYSKLAWVLLVFFSGPSGPYLGAGALLGAFGALLGTFGGTSGGPLALEDLGGGPLGASLHYILCAARACALRIRILSPTP